MKDFEKIKYLKNMLTLSQFSLYQVKFLENLLEEAFIVGRIDGLEKAMEIDKKI